MTAYTAAGAKLFISSAPSTADDQPGFEGLSYTEVGEITNFGDFGRVYNLVTHNPVGNRKTFKKKGSYNDGSLQLTVARDPSDAGQAIITTALDSDSAYGFKITLNDASEGSPSAPTTFYFNGLVMSYPVTLGSVDSVVQANITIEIDGTIIEVPKV